MKALHYALLNRKGAVLIVAAVQNHRRTFNFARGIAWVARPDFRRLLVPHRRIIRNEGAHGRGRGNKMNSEATAHAIAHHPDSGAVDVAARETISPTSIDYAHEIGVGRFVLNLSAFVDVSFRRVAKHVKQIGKHCGLTELVEAR